MGSAVCVVYWCTHNNAISIMEENFTQARCSVSGFPNARFVAGVAAAAVLSIGLAESSVAAPCASDSTLTLDTFDVTIDGMPALDCGYGDTNNDFVTPPPSTWSVNTDNSGGIPGAPDWNGYHKTEIDEGTGSTSSSWENGAGVDLQLTSFTGSTNDPYQSGTFSLNASDPLLIVLKEGSGGTGNYAWYYFEDKTGPLTGTWDTTNPFGGHNLSHMTAYVVPVPAAVWLFGTGLLGLFGVARRRSR